MYINTFDKPEIHTAMLKFCARCEEHGINSTEASLRWIMYHSFLGEGDGIIVGATRVDQLKGNIEKCAKGPLGEALVKAAEELWDSVKGRTTWD